MTNPFVCGNFNNQEEEYDLDELLSPCSTPKKSSRKSGKDYSKNPYADRGLDKFSALLAELEGKKQKIYTQKGSEDISFVRFVYSGSDNWRPIVVKSKDRKQDNNNHSGVINNQGNNKEKQQNSEDKHAIEASTTSAVNGGGGEQKEEKKRIVKLGEIEFVKNLKHPYYHLPLVMLLILLLLAVYGRSFAVLCTSLGWYLVPMIKERSSSTTSEKTKVMARRLSDKSMAGSGSVVVSNSDNKTKNKEKDYTRRFSENNMGSSNNIVRGRSSSPMSPRPSSSSSPKSVLSGPGENPTRGRHSHKKSW